MAYSCFASPGHMLRKNSTPAPRPVVPSPSGMGSWHKKLPQEASWPTAHGRTTPNHRHQALPQHLQRSSVKQVYERSRRKSTVAVAKLETPGFDTAQPSSDEEEEGKEPLSRDEAWQWMREVGVEPNPAIDPFLTAFMSPYRMHLTGMEMIMLGTFDSAWQCRAMADAAEEKGRYDDAEYNYTELLQYFLEQKGSDNIIVSVYLNSIATCMALRSPDCEDAVPLLEKALDIALDQLQGAVSGEQDEADEETCHTNVQSSAVRLANVLNMVGRHGKAEAVAEAQLARTIQAFGTDSPNAHACRIQLMIASSLQGKHATAAAHMREAADAHMRREHGSVAVPASSLNNNESLVMQDLPEIEALACKDGDSGVSTITQRRLLARCLMCLQLPVDACFITLKLLLKNLEECSRGVQAAAAAGATAGGDDSVAAFAAAAAAVCEEAIQNAEAANKWVVAVTPKTSARGEYLEMYTEVMRDLQDKTLLPILGQDHPTTIIVTRNLGSLIKEAADALSEDDPNRAAMYGKVAEVWQRVLDSNTTVHGPEASETIEAMVSLALAHEDSEDPPVRSEALYRKALPLCLRNFGLKHKTTARCFKGLCVCLRNRPAEQEDTARQFLKAMGAIPLRWIVLLPLAMSLQNQWGRAEEAEAVWREALGCGEQLNDAFAIDYCRNGLARCLAKQGKREEAASVVS